MSELLKPGDTLGNYEIVNELAIGGMAAIYLARARGKAGFEKHVVLKSILPALASDRHLVESFLDEARLAATLQHSNIADVFDVGAQGSTYFFAMEYVHGENARTIRLVARHKQVRIPLEVAVAIAMGVGSALAYAHDRHGPHGPLDIVHRDVSPSNILVSHEGGIKLVDFGIARTTMRNAKTRTGARKGKTSYMSPEQCRGQAIDRRSDLFSLGTVLYELTAPQRPFVGSSDFEVMDAIVATSPPRPSELVPGYPVELERIVMRLLEISPAARYQSAHELVEDLERFTQRHQMLTSAHVVARFMGTLFTPEADTASEIAALSTRSSVSTAEMPLLDIAYDALPEHVDDEPTTTFRSGPTRQGDVKLVLRPAAERRSEASRRTATGAVPVLDSSLPAPQHAGDAAPPAAYGEHTHQDVVDPVAERAAELRAEIDGGAPLNETPEQRACRRVDTLLHQAMALLALGEPDRAVIAIELALDEGTASAEAERLIQSHVDTIVQVYEALLEDPYRTPARFGEPDALVLFALEDGSRRLLDMVDGRTTITQLIQQSGMERLEAYHYLCQLLLRGLIQL